MNVYVLGNSAYYHLYVCFSCFLLAVCEQPDELPHYSELVQYVADRHIIMTAELMVSWCTSLYIV